MSNIVIKIDSLSKQYRLGTVGAGTLRGDFQRWVSKMRGKDDPFLKIGHENTLDQMEGEYVWALKDINFEVKKGEVLGIIGKNGAGKSTLLKILSRVTGPTKGSVKVKGRIASLLEVGTGFHPELTGRENIFLNGAILGMKKSEIKNKLDEIVNFAGVAKYIDTPVKRYSSGMHVRLAFSVAAHLEPEILVVDEVLAVGDAEFQKKAVGKMQDVSKQGGRSVLFVSHNMVSVQNLCENAIVLNNGKKVIEDSVDNAIQFYINSTHYDTIDKNLKNRIDRKGEGVLRFLSWQGYIDKNTENETAISGKTYTIEFEVEAFENIENVVFSLAFYNRNEVFYSACRSDCIKRTYRFKKGRHKVFFYLENLPFSKGEYVFNSIAYEGNIIQDWIKKAGKINVEPGDYYQTGILPASGRQGILINYDWN